MRKSFKKSSQRGGAKSGSGHAYWSGQIKIALIYMPVHLYNAVRRNSAAIDLDLIDRKSGERVHHANVLENGDPVADEDIVRGYKTDRGYVYLEKEELQGVKLPSSDILEILQFVDANVPFTHFEKPLYVLPSGRGGEEIYVTLRDAMYGAHKIGIGQLTVRGREELCALIPHGDGLVIELLRYAGELRAPEDSFADYARAKAKAADVKMAQELITQLSEPLNLREYEDHYHEAMMELIQSKQARRLPHYETAKAKPKNVVNLMDALRKSLRSSKPAAKKSARKKRTA